MPQEKSRERSDFSIDSREHSEISADSRERARDYSSVFMAGPALDLKHHPTHVVLDLGCTRSIGSRTAIDRFRHSAEKYGIRIEFVPCRKSFIFANSETETCVESCVIHFPTTPACSTSVDVLEHR